MNIDNGAPAKVVKSGKVISLCGESHLKEIARSFLKTELRQGYPPKWIDDLAGSTVLGRKDLIDNDLESEIGRILGLSWVE